MTKPATNIVSIDAAWRRAVCDEFGELDRQVKAFSPIATRHDKLRKVIQEWVPDSLGAEETETYSGLQYTIQLSERSEEAQFSVNAKKSLWKLLKAQKAWRLFSITQKAVAAELGADVCEGHLIRKRTGSRKVTAVAIAPAEAA